MLDRDLCAHRLQAFDMLNHRAGADLAATGQGHLGHAHSGQQGANAEETGPKAVHQLVRGRGAIDVSPVEFEGVAGAANLAAKTHQHVAHAHDVGERGYVAKPDLVPGKQASRHQHQGGILGSADAQLSAELAATAHEQVGARRLVAHVGGWMKR
jgi:hypothetical protein